MGIKKLFGLFLLALLIPLLSTPSLQAQDTQNFVIDSMKVDYRLSKNSDDIALLSVTEKITARFPDYDQNHGILRALPQNYNGNELSLKILSVTDATTNKINFSTYKENSNLVLKIGDANKYVHGEVVYTINYSYKNVIAFYDENDEFFWNINGVQWYQPFGEVTARLYIPADLSLSLQDRQICYSGAYGAKEHNCTIERLTEDNGDTLITVKAFNLGVGENVSFVLAWDKGTFKPDPWPDIFAAIGLGLFLLIPLTTLIFMMKKWKKEGKDPEGSGIIVPQYSPPKTFDALRSIVILKQQFDVDAISASIIELATLGYIKVYETTEKQLIGSKKNYELELIKSASNLSADQKIIIKTIFDSETAVGTRVNLSDKSNELYKPIQKLAKSLPEDLTKEGFFKSNPTKAFSNTLILGIILMIGGFITMFIFGFMESFLLFMVALGTIAAGIIILPFAFIMPARSKEGVKIREHLLGLKDYMKLAEADRIKFLQSPEGIKQFGDPKDPKTHLHLYEKLLPFAMLFGIEKDWSKQFEKYFTQAPDWYSGPSGVFNPVIFAGSLGGLSSASSVAFSAPSSSGGSGFGGGGGSGGGGGGGGGGGW